MHTNKSTKGWVAKEETSKGQTILPYNNTKFQAIKDGIHSDIFQNPFFMRIETFIIFLNNS